MLKQFLLFAVHINKTLLYNNEKLTLWARRAIIFWTEEKPFQINRNAQFFIQYLFNLSSDTLHVTHKIIEAISITALWKMVQAVPPCHISSKPKMVIFWFVETSIPLCWCRLCSLNCIIIIQFPVFDIAFNSVEYGELFRSTCWLFDNTRDGLLIWNSLNRWFFKECRFSLS